MVKFSLVEVVAAACNGDCTDNGSSMQRRVANGALF
jgi:hypothetical protein